jgi:uncharacterized membrane protein
LFHPLQGPTHDDKVWAGLSYAGAICFFFGLPALMIYFLKRGESGFIRLHALQAFCFSLCWLALFILTLLFSIFSWINGPVGFLLFLAPVVYWVYLMIQAFLGNDRRMPWLGDWLASRVSD